MDKPDYAIEEAMPIIQRARFERQPGDFDEERDKQAGLLVAAVMQAFTKAGHTCLDENKLSAKIDGSVFWIQLAPNKDHGVDIAIAKSAMLRDPPDIGQPDIEFDPAKSRFVGRCDAVAAVATAILQGFSAAARKR